MKKIIFCVFVQIMSVTASFASIEYTCSQAADQSKSTYTVNVLTGLPGEDGKGELIVLGIKNPIQLSCYSAAIEPGAPDQIYPVAECMDSTGLYQISITEGGFTGLTLATISKERADGFDQVAVLVCKVIEKQ